MTSVVAPEKREPTSQTEGKYKESLPGVVNLPLDEVKQRRYGETQQGQVNRATFVRVDYAGELEEAVNRQIDFDFSLGYTLLAMAAYFDRDTVSLPGIAKYFRSMSESSWSDAEKKIAFQNMRGGKVQLMAVPMPDSDYYNADKGDALYAFELALALQKLGLDKLKAMHGLADQSDDYQVGQGAAGAAVAGLLNVAGADVAALFMSAAVLAQDFIEDEMSSLAKTVKELGDRACELKRVGTGHGVFHFDERIDSL
ncbi:hypothetical protein CHLNCDRAFT_144557 [Chlorella variabilis]|uniref:Ferritin n=1 Tax=Chlorella variabilis TaxID=554065 RepID=E1ZBP2_CHLVA|nr:hypothetical protein CHLNCDRAFT_144557 [Chlorella variabilis]EFN56891.1 hypothetical protein CHLNCDRAFT_144557 [Chlorella variabilis]|eukprot:XP_005848993.1 hypothetical protein CHLNCDRAFT_144557 [Chlorella variabilis]